MPELPEVETTLRGIERFVVGHRIEQAVLRHTGLRWPITRGFASHVVGQTVQQLRRRAKYLIFDLDAGAILLHLGMSGSLRVLPAHTPVRPHDHVDLVLDSDRVIRFNDPRRFGCVLWVAEDPLQHPLLASLAPEPLSDEFDADYLADACRGRSVAIKQLLMNGQVVVGVGNIYASEALFRSRIRPRRSARRLRREEIAALVQAVKDVLQDAIRAGGTTLRHYVNAEGNPGYFRQKLFVYGRSGEPCLVCGSAIKHFVQGQRSTYFCPSCQK